MKNEADDQSTQSATPRTRWATLRGVEFEREVHRLFDEAGFTVRDMEPKGDRAVFALQRDGVVLTSACRRQERLKIPEWWRQATAEAPAGTVPVLTFRKSEGEMLSLLRTADLVRLLAR